MRQDARSSQARLRAVATTLFAQRGYEATSISDIVRAAGTSHSQFLKYYSGKEELRREIIEEQWAELTKAVVLAISSLPSLLGKLRLALSMVVNFLDKNPEFRAILLLEQTAVHENGTVVISNQFLELVAVLDNIMGEMKTAGELKPGVDPQALRSALMGSVEGMMRDQMLAASEFPAHYSVEQVRATVSFLIEAACDVQRPSPDLQPTAPAEAAPGSEDDWIRYYLKLADKVLVQ
jgi:TetR/AcrR family transcriptional regulator, fatty acid metabolism regulator protein